MSIVDGLAGRAPGPCSACRRVIPVFREPGIAACKPREVRLKDARRVGASRRERGCAEDAEADAVTVTAAGEAIAARRALHGETRALQQVPAKLLPDRAAEIIYRQRGGRQALRRDVRHQRRTNRTTPRRRRRRRPRPRRARYSRRGRVRDSRACSASACGALGVVALHPRGASAADVSHRERSGCAACRRGSRFAGARAADRQRKCPSATSPPRHQQDRAATPARASSRDRHSTAAFARRRASRRTRRCRTPARDVTPSTSVDQHLPARALGRGA